MKNFGIFSEVAWIFWRKKGQKGDKTGKKIVVVWEWSFNEDRICDVLENQKGEEMTKKTHQQTNFI